MPDGLNGLTYIGYSTNGSTGWESLGAYAGAVKVSGGDLKVGEFLSFDDAYPMILTGKFDPSRVQVRLLYTDGTTEPYAKLRALMIAKTQVYLRWSYTATTANYWKSRGYLISVPAPDSDAASADPIAVEIVQATPKIEEVRA